MFQGVVKLAFLVLIIRLTSVYIVRTSYVPDEYWQSLEVAHKIAFGYGYLTWEWIYDVRSYLYPAIIAACYKILQLCAFDSMSAVVYAPRVLQAVMSFTGDLAFWLWYRKHKHNSGAWALFSLSTSWFWYYCASRTLSNVLETVLTLYGLYFFPWGEAGKKKRSPWFLFFMGLACIVRPTAVIVWLPLCLYHLACCFHPMQVILQHYIPVGLILAISSTALDSYFANHLVFTPWNFFKTNVVLKVSSSYGELPMYWYLTHGIPPIVGLHLIPFCIAARKLLTRRYTSLLHLPVEAVLLAVIIWTIFVFSCLPHKEHRFLLPILPMFLFISAGEIGRWSRTASRTLLWIVAMLFILTFMIPVFYFGTIHQRGVVDLMPVLSVIASQNPKTELLFLMPCHSTPLYSHLHVNVSARFLTCEPNLGGLKDYVDEADMFYENPMSWLNSEYSEPSLPSKIVIFNVLQPHIQHFLKKFQYTILTQFFHTSVQSERVGEYILVYTR